MSGKTSLKVDSELRDRIRAKKVGGETYSDVLDRLLSKVDGPDSTD